ncbi:uncharacterized protein P884DRAFT_214969 [Thermothelomyces heterothallicus CBS 202.75]|uniref:uncharacterized protein n=1 Tax=Thermothelomyces heterothallicus CBS 202.75 TaxID=1149848 RepID=UPI0037440333
MESPRSPKRRRILASINPPEPRTEDGAPKGAKRDCTTARAGSTPLPDEDDRTGAHDDDYEDDSHTREERREQQQHRHHRHHHDGRRRRRRRHHRHEHRSAEGEQEDDPFQDPPLSPNTAFRESLFDAMADDEGAAYWEAVYGQPIHIYGPPPGSGSGSGSGGGSGGGMLERMTDDEYAAYVRRKMWEKTHEGLLEARARRERERRRAREEAEAARAVEREMERCLRRGEERRRRREWRHRWERYLRRAAIPCWPVAVTAAAAAAADDDDDDEEGGEIRGEAVREFFVKGIGLDEVGEREFAARLKEERVRWHPDKVQQRLGGKVDDGIMRNVTAVFQAIDALWNDTRKQHSG